MKKALRKSIKEKFRTLQEKDFLEKSAAAENNLRSLPLWKDAEVVFAFISMKDEIAMEHILKAVLDENKILAVPRIEGEDLVFHRIDDLSSALEEGRYGIPEPLPSAPEIFPLSGTGVLFLVPGLAFDRRRFRLGRGKGFYDRYLSSVADDVLKIGIGYDFQIAEAVPTEPHDKRLDMIITDSEIIS